MTPNWCAFKDTGNNTLFVRLILSPEVMPNCNIVSMHVGIETSGSNRNNKRSSTYNKSVVTCPPLVIPIISLFCLKAIASGSIERSKRRGDSGHTFKDPETRVYVCVHAYAHARVCVCVELHGSLFLTFVSFQHTTDGYMVVCLNVSLCVFVLLSLQVKGAICKN